ncbi:hypothetical protein MIR68_003327 [Amoeboaphelidium protococcarum]|nr:hypothetical protein MIR68_003327 [Amoeboaphelidium protococcarum]
MKSGISSVGVLFDGSNRRRWKNALYAQLQSAGLEYVIDVEFQDTLQRIPDRHTLRDRKMDLLAKKKVEDSDFEALADKTSFMPCSEHDQQAALITFQEEQHQANSMVLGLIKGSVIPEVLSSIGTQSSAQEALEAVEEYFNLKAPSNASNIDAKIRNELCDDKYHSAMQFVVQLEEWFDDLTDCGFGAMDENQFVQLVALKLPLPKYNEVRKIVMNLNINVTNKSEELVEKLSLIGLKKSILHTDNMALLEQQCNRPYASSPVSSDKARQVEAAVQNVTGVKRPFAQRQGGRIICDNCGKFGHSKSDCFAEGGGKENPDSPHDMNQEKEFSPDLSFLDRISTVLAQSSDDIDWTSSWLYDPGSTDFITCRQDWLLNESSCQVNSFGLVQGPGTKVSSIGTIVVSLNDGEGDCRVAQFHDICYSPQYRFNLVPGGKLAQQGFRSVLDDKGLEVFKDGKKILSGQLLRNGLVLLNITVLSPDVCDLDSLTNSIISAVNVQGSQPLSQMDFHVVLGHVNFSCVRSMFKMNYFENWNIDEDSMAVKLNQQDCDVCVQSKFVKASYQADDAKSLRSSQSLELLHVDLIGPIQVLSLNRQNYVLVVQDDYSGYTSVRLLKAKSDASVELRRLCAKQCDLLEKSVKTIRCDRGSEFLNAVISDWCADLGIVLDLTPGYTPERNGVVERCIRTLVERTRSFLLDSQSPNFLWGFAMESAAYLQNRLLTSGRNRAGQLKCTPFEVFFGNKPKLSHVIPWGSMVHYFVPKEKRVGKFKFSSTSALGRLVGYSESDKDFIVLPQHSRSVIPVSYQSAVAAMQSNITDAAGLEDYNFLTTAIDEQSVSDGSDCMQFDVMPSQGAAGHTSQSAERHVARGDQSVTYMSRDLLTSQSAERDLNDSNEIAATEYSQSGVKVVEQQSTSCSDDEELIRISEPKPYAVEPKAASSADLDDQTVRQLSISERDVAISDPEGLSVTESMPGDYDDWPIPTFPNGSISDVNPSKQHLAHLMKVNDSAVVLSHLSSWLHAVDDHHWFDWDEIVSLSTLLSPDSRHIPQTYREAMTLPDSGFWQEAVDSEWGSMLKNETLERCVLPPGRKALPCRWVFKIKIKSDGTIERYKARLVIKGFKQVYGLDFFDTFAPTPKNSTVRLVLSVAAHMDMELHHADVSTAFLNGDLEEEIYVIAPDGTPPAGEVLRLRKSVYGLKQAPRQWNKKLHETLVGLGFKRCHSDNCLYTRTHQNRLFLLLIYVDDLVLACKSIAQIQEVKQQLKKSFDIHDLQELEYLTGIRVNRDRSKRQIVLDQETYCKKILQRFKFEDCAPAPTPMSKRMLVDNNKFSDIQQYRAVIGSIMYLMVGTRPDLTYAVSELSRYCSSPGLSHWSALKRLLRYIAGTSDYSLVIDGSSYDALIPRVYVDSDHAGDLQTRRSVCGYDVKLCNCAIIWKSKLQPQTALSSTEAEYYAAFFAGQEIVWLKELMKEAGIRRLLSEVSIKSSDLFCQNVQKHPFDSTVVFEDNEACIKIAKNPEKFQRTKHIEVRYHILREWVEKNIIHFEHIGSNLQIADLRTKPVCRTILYRHLASLGIVSSQSLYSERSEG